MLLSSFQLNPSTSYHHLTPSPRWGVSDKKLGRVRVSLPKVGSRSVQHRWYGLLRATRTAIELWALVPEAGRACSADWLPGQ